MKSFFCERKKNFTCPSLSESSGLNVAEDLESEIEEAQKLNKTKLRYISHKSSKIIEIASIKNLPTIFFILFLITLSAVVVKLVPTVYALSKKTSLFQQRKNIDYLPSYIAEQPLAVKVKY
jgi:hypothetical protein